MIIKKNKELIEKRNFLIRALEHNNITQEEYDAEVPALDKKIRENLAVSLKEEYAKVAEEIKQIKVNVISDGNFKREVAKVLIKYLKDDLTPAEIKGVFRQGYKIMRTEI